MSFGRVWLFLVDFFPQLKSVTFSRDFFTCNQSWTHALGIDLLFWELETVDVLRPLGSTSDNIYTVCKYQASFIQKYQSVRVTRRYADANVTVSINGDSW